MGFHGRYRPPLGAPDPATRKHPTCPLPSLAGKPEGVNTLNCGAPAGLRRLAADPGRPQEILAGHEGLESPLGLGWALAH